MLLLARSRMRRAMILGPELLTGWLMGDGSSPINAWKTCIHAYITSSRHLSQTPLGANLLHIGSMTHISPLKLVTLKSNLSPWLVWYQGFLSKVLCEHFKSKFLVPECGSWSPWPYLHTLECLLCGGIGLHQSRQLPPSQFESFHWGHPSEALSICCKNKTAIRQPQQVLVSGLWAYVEPTLVLDNPPFNFCDIAKLARENIGQRQVASELDTTIFCPKEEMHQTAAGTSVFVINEHFQNRGSAIFNTQKYQATFTNLLRYGT